MQFSKGLAVAVLLAALVLAGLVGCSTAAPVPSIDATVEAKVQATLVAAPTQTPLATYTPYPTAAPAATYTPYPTQTPLPGATPVSMPTPFPADDQSHRPTPIPANETSVDTDRAALVAFYNATGGPDWNNDWNWLTDRPLGNWNGVTTDGSGRVTELELSNNNLVGYIPPELGNLSHLTRIRFLGNSLSGSIPPEMGNLANLTVLILNHNELTGQIPPELGNLSGLTQLYLPDNKLTGNVPPELGNLSNLTQLVLFQNKLTGEIPMTFTMLTELFDFGWAVNDGLCAPLNPIQDWLQGIRLADGPTCPRR